MTNAQMDIQLVEEIKVKQSTKAFEILFNKYYKSILFKISSMLVDKTLAEDITMIVFEKAYRNIEKFNKDSGAFSTWLYTLAKNSFIDTMRKQRKIMVSLESFTIDDSENATIIEFESNFKTPYDIITKNERENNIREIIHKALISKPTIEKIVKMRYLEEMSYAEIAKITDIPLGTVKAHLFRAKELLKETIGEQEIYLQYF